MKLTVDMNHTAFYTPNVIKWCKVEESGKQCFTVNMNIR